MNLKILNLTKQQESNIITKSNRRARCQNKSAGQQQLEYVTLLK